MQTFNPRNRSRRAFVIPFAIITCIIFAGFYLRNLAWCFTSKQGAITDSIIFQLQTQYQRQYQNVSRTLVVGHTNSEDISWVHEELPNIKTAVYSVDKPKEPYVVTKNKGNEAMIYLTYIIDHYHNLPDVVLFFHAHRKAWHNNYLFDNDSVKTVLQLDPEEVVKKGYVNTRCQRNPGCPSCAGALKADNPTSKLDRHINENWQALHQVRTMPSRIGQPCCAQFAASRAAIHSRPLSSYKHYRNWLLETPLSDRISGQIFEFSWQYIFGGVAEYCPSELDCLYKNYGIHFDSQAELNDYRRTWRMKDNWLLWFWKDTRALERDLNRRKLDAYRQGIAKKRNELTWR